MRKIDILTIGAAGILLLSTSCATLFTKTNQEITFKGVPGTQIKDKDKDVQLGLVGDNGFTTVKLKKQLKSKRIEASRDGYDTQSFMLNTKIQGAFWCNLFLGGILGAGVDAATGKMMKYTEDVVNVTLQKSTEEISEEPVPIVEPVQESEQQTVNRQNPGTTDMEKAIIRWNIDSDPRGARVSYRVISNIPAEVKNTNETYMTTTPLEETRSFNILGLTYENSTNVSIEIKVEKRGYETQVKRYNVRMALDQQEISSFFELVPKEAKKTNPTKKSQPASTGASTKNSKSSKSTNKKK